MDGDTGSEAGAVLLVASGEPIFEAVPRAEGLDYFPCSDCHEGEPVNPVERPLEEEHGEIVLTHGAGQFWCLSCHDMGRDGDVFVSAKGDPIDFDAAFQLCGSCHFEQKRDWTHGAHGKRAGTWNDYRDIPETYPEMLVTDREAIGHWGTPRVLLSCPACHNPHAPEIPSFTPSPPPPVRKGLNRRDTSHPSHPRAWERDRRPSQAQNDPE